MLRSGLPRLDRNNARKDSSAEGFFSPTLAPSCLNSDLCVAYRLLPFIEGERGVVSGPESCSSVAPARTRLHRIVLLNQQLLPVIDMNVLHQVMMGKNVFEVHSSPVGQPVCFCTKQK